MEVICRVRGTFSYAPKPLPAAFGKPASVVRTVSAASFRVFLVFPPCGDSYSRIASVVIGRFKNRAIGLQAGAHCRLPLLNGASISADTQRFSLCQHGRRWLALDRANRRPGWVASPYKEQRNDNRRFV